MGLVRKGLSVTFPPASPTILLITPPLHLALFTRNKESCDSLPYLSGASQGQGPCVIHLCIPSTKHSAWHKEGAQCWSEMNYD